MAPVKFYVAGTQVSQPAVLYPRKARNRVDQSLRTMFSHLLKYKKQYLPKRVCSALFRVSPGAAPPLPSQLKDHFSFCSANLRLIIESFVSFDPVYPCCCIVCDLPTKLSRSHHCLTLTSSGWDTLQKYTNLCKINKSQALQINLQANNTQANLKNSSS